MTAGHIADDDGWGTTVRSALAERTDLDDLEVLLAHLARPVAAASPSKSWRLATRALLDAPANRRVVKDMVEAISTTPTIMGVIENQFGQTGPVVVGFANADVARGSIWAAGLLKERWVPRALGAAFSRACERNDEFFAGAKVPNACLATLADIGSPEAIDRLWRFEATVEKRGFHNQVVKALASAALASGATVSELIEGTAPHHGLDADCRREVEVGEVMAVIALDRRARASLGWMTGDGGVRKTVPAAVRSKRARRLGQLQEEVRSINHSVSFERRRLEQLISEDRSWSVERWARAYWEHPITAALARDMLWKVESPDGPGSVGIITSVSPLKVRTPLGLSTVGAGSQEGIAIRPWHPIDSAATEVLQLRELVVTRQVRQPFKQAFREVYPLTPAERQTLAYSNRFAAHVLRYPQFYALLRARRWWSDYLDTYGDGGQDGQAWRDFPDAGIQARFYFEAGDPNASRVDLCVTDQVRFVRIGDRKRTPVTLDEVPAVVFSEAMRDIDLFVSVASVANDPTWEDRGTDRERDYWRDAVFGALGTSAETRRDALERVLPALRIADRCSIEERWLEVRGDLRTYRIHLGSANVRMEPNDEYLCIVADRDARLGKVYLPFDDDPLLAMVLSKAFLLANDSAIEDETILQQIRG